MTQRIFTVDRKDASGLILIDESGLTVRVDSGRMPPNCQQEGAILRVELATTGAPDWKTAKRHTEREAAVRSDATRRLSKLAKSDPGGDVEL
jgi:hypothetical protein